MKKRFPRRVLLFNPPQYCVEDALRIWSLAYEANFPLAPLRFSSMLKASGVDVEFLDAFNVHPNTEASYRLLSGEDRLVRRAPCGNDSREGVFKPVYHVGMLWEELAERLSRMKPPDEVWVSSIFTWSWQSTHRAVDLLRRGFPRAQIRLGGIYPTLCGAQAARTGARLHAGPIPEAESAWLDADILARREGLEGIVLKTSRGCPHDCSYCAVHVIEGRAYHFRDPSEVLEELDALHQRLRLGKIFFWESNLLLKPRRHIVRILEGLVARAGRYALQAPEGLQPGLITPELAVLMRAAGFRDIRLTLETADPARLKESGRPGTLAQLERAARALLDAGFGAADISIVLLVGQPRQTLDGVLRDIAHAYSLGLKTTFLAYSPIPGTRDFSAHRDLIGDRALEDLDSFLFPMAGPQLTVAALGGLFRAFNNRHIPLSRAAGAGSAPALLRALREGARSGETPR